MCKYLFPKQSISFLLVVSLLFSTVKQNDGMKLNFRVCACVCARSRALEVEQYGCLRVFLFFSVDQK